MPFLSHDKTSFFSAEGRSQVTSSWSDKLPAFGYVKSRFEHVIYLSTCLTAANISNRAGAIQMFEKHLNHLQNTQALLCDAGYAGINFASAIHDLLDAEVQIAKRSELHTFKVIPKRWVVERPFAWLEKCRRLWKNCERFLHTSLQMVVLAFISLLIKRS